MRKNELLKRWFENRLILIMLFILFANFFWNEMKGFEQKALL